VIESALLYFFCALALAGAAAMIVARHPMRVAVALITCMLSLAAIYALVGVHVIAIFQVLIYVGAVMVFMVYVIMLVDVGARARFSRLLVPGIIAFAALVVILRYALAQGEPSTHTGKGAFAIQPFSAAFLNEYWLYFELVSVLLVAAVVAAIAVVKTEGKRRG
jgi:NADH-quinone oxidoreductase subunit J